ncbi:MAG: EamA family transporter [Sedimentisphaerales bacterium]|nr:EamA family transporter [Sedimentisphaerales bacterium]
MKTWLLYALLATFSWGTYIVAAKIATSSKYCGLEPQWSAILMWAGIGIVFVLYWLLSGGEKLKLNLPSILAGVSSGGLWALGMLFSLCAIKAGADVARLAPIYNSNTLVAVLLGIVLLHEVRDGAGIFKVVIGSVLIVLGGILVTR